MERQAPGDPRILGPRPRPRLCVNSAGWVGRPGPLRAPLPATPRTRPGRAARQRRVRHPDPTLRAPTSAPGAGQRRRRKINGPKATGNQNRLDSNRKVVGSSPPRDEPHAQLVEGASPGLGLPGAQRPTPGSQPHCKPGPRGGGTSPPRRGRRRGGGSALRPQPQTPVVPSHPLPAPGRPVPLSSHPGHPLPPRPGARVSGAAKVSEGAESCGLAGAGAYLVRRARAAAPGRAGAPGAVACLPAGCPPRPVGASCAGRRDSGSPRAPGEPTGGGGPRRPSPSWLAGGAGLRWPLGPRSAPRLVPSLPAPRPHPRPCAPSRGRGTSEVQAPCAPPPAPPRPRPRRSLRSPCPPPGRAPPRAPTRRHLPRPGHAVGAGSSGVGGRGGRGLGARPWGLLLVPKVSRSQKFGLGLRRDPATVPDPTTIGNHLHLNGRGGWGLEGNGEPAGGQAPPGVEPGEVGRSGRSQVQETLAPGAPAPEPRGRSFKPPEDRGWGPLSLAAGDLTQSGVASPRRRPREGGPE